MESKYNQEAEQEKSISLQEMLDALMDENTTLPAKFLYRLSDIEGDELTAIASIWEKITSERRLRLLEDLEQLEDSNTIVSFKSICQLALKDEQADVRLIAIRALWIYEDPGLIPVLFDFLANDSSDEVRAQAAAGLGRFILLGELGKISTDKTQSIEEKLLEIMKSDQPEIIRLRALESLGYSGRESVNDVIEESYSFGDEQWVSSAIFAISRSADKQWAANILEKLDVTHPQHRLEAVRAAGALGLEEATPALLYLLEGEDPDIMLAAAWSLSQIGGEEVREALEDLIPNLDQDEEIDFIEEALENLDLTEEIGDFSILDIPEEDLESLEDDILNEDI